VAEEKNRRNEEWANTFNFDSDKYICYIQVHYSTYPGGTTMKGHI
jgi:hypothetical protein